MTEITPASVTPGSDLGSLAAPPVILSAEQLVTSTEWIESGHVRLRKQIVSETRTLEVIVRREELIVEVRDAIAVDGVERFVGTNTNGSATSTPSEGRRPLTVVLLREVPEVVMHVSPYERVTAEVLTIQDTAVWHDSVRYERAELSNGSAASPSGPRASTRRSAEE